MGALARKLLSDAKKVAYPAMAPADEVDVRGDSGYRRLTGDVDDEEKGCGIRGADAAWTRAELRGRHSRRGRALQVAWAAGALKLRGGNAGGGAKS